jgi:CRP-like cAMP-binding protein
MSSNFPPEMFREIPLFDQLRIDEIEQLLAVADDRDFETDEVIIQEGGHDRALYVIFDGEVEVVLPTPTFAETPVVKLAAGGVFGESTFFHASPHVATVRCLTPVSAMRLPRDRFDRLLEHGSLAAYKLGSNAARVLAERLQATDRWIENLVQEHADAEIAARWREFRHRIAFGHSIADYGPLGSFAPVSS